MLCAFIQATKFKKSDYKLIRSRKKDVQTYLLKIADPVIREQMLARVIDKSNPLGRFFWHGHRIASRRIKQLRIEYHACKEANVARMTAEVVKHAGQVEDQPVLNPVEYQESEPAQVMKRWRFFARRSRQELRPVDSATLPVEIGETDHDSLVAPGGVQNESQLISIFGKQPAVDDSESGFLSDKEFDLSSSM